MSKKYYDRLLTGTGETKKEVKSKFGTKMMESMGWEKGKGLGKNLDGMTDCIQIKRRDEGTGIGDVNETPAATFKWGNAFWDDAYKQAADNFKHIEVKPDRKLVDSDQESSSESIGFSDLEIIASKGAQLRKKEEKKEKKSKKIKKDKKDKKAKKAKKAKKRADSDTD